MASLRSVTTVMLILYALGLAPAQAQPCREYWVCTDWSFCMGSGVQLRSCADAARCGTESQKPPEAQNCTPKAVRYVVTPPPIQQDSGVTGLIVSNTPTILALVMAALGVVVFITYRKWKDIRMFISSP